MSILVKLLQIRNQLSSINQHPNFSIRKTYLNSIDKKLDAITENTSELAKNSKSRKLLNEVNNEYNYTNLKWHVDLINQLLEESKDERLSEKCHEKIKENMQNLNKIYDAIKTPKSVTQFNTMTLAEKLMDKMGMSLNIVNKFPSPVLSRIGHFKEAAPQTMDEEIDLTLTAKS